MRCIPSNKFIVALAFFTFTVLFFTQSALRETIYLGYAFPRIWLKSWNQPWKHIPMNDALYSGTHDCGYDSVQSPQFNSCLIHDGRHLSWFDAEQAKSCSRKLLHVPRYPPQPARLRLGRSNQALDWIF
jgi:hypothetical protein